jgi:hypothetical protein
MTDITSHDKESLIKDIQSVAQRLDKRSVSRAEFIRETSISEWHVLKFFDSWNEFVIAAGLQPTDVSRIDDEELFKAMYEAFIKGEGILTRTRFRKLCRYSDYVYSKRWGTWDSVLNEFRQWVETNHSDFPYISEFPKSISAPDEFTESENKSPLSTKQHAWTPTGGRLYGPILNFRGLQHAPINEQGVVLLFGMVAFELGFVVESVASGFPDCEAKRRIDRRGDKWERVRIEFEYRSRSFKDHGHDPSKCELLVCWEDNWPECPIEVLELRSAIEALDPE